MDNKGIDIFFGATSLRTCLGNKVETCNAMRDTKCGLKYDERFGMYTGAADIRLTDGYTRFESAMIEQTADVLAHSGLNVADPEVQFIVATTKGNVELLADGCETLADNVFPDEAVQKVASYFGFANRAVIISNACISGLSAFIVAREMMLSGYCSHAIIVGCDVLSEFITAGFASFKSISGTPCRPYDAERDGLTLGEACGAVVLTTDKRYAVKPYINFRGGVATNDANHISGPSRTGDGLCHAIVEAMRQAGISAGDVGFTNMHGTATRYNDEMESKAAIWAGVNDKPLNGLKGYIGHTLGAAGVVETILCTEQLRQGYIYGSCGFNAADATYPISVSSQQQPFDKRCCIKTASGFGGCNAAIVLDMEKRASATNSEKSARKAETVAEYSLPHSGIPFAEFIRAEFRDFGKTDIKFYKMSDMSKALYVAVEHLLAIENFGDTDPVRRAIVLANHSSSLDADIAHQRILDRHLPEGASPATFIYTLPNVAAGEMCIRHKIQGNNTFFIEKDDSGLAERYAERLIAADRADAVICGWCEYLEGNWNINIKLLKNN